MWPWRHRELHVQDWLWVLRNRALGTWVTHRCCLELPAEDTVPSLKAPQKIRHPLFCEIPLPTPLILPPLQSRPRIRDHQASSDARGARCCGGRSGCGPGGLGRAGSSRGSRPRSTHEQEVPRGAMSSFSPHLPPAPSRGCRSPVSCCPESAWGLSGNSGILERQENLPRHAQARQITL